MSQSDPKDNLSSVAEGDHPVLETVFAINIDALERSGLDQDTYLLVRLAALVALDAPPVSYAVTLGAAVDSGVTAEKAQAVLVAIAPLVGTPRITAAAGNMLRVLGGMEALAESEPE
ncbi:carboxymuconolactone decarboxylase family protein [Georgenia thermotolerans]|uniref:Carboxymuconolactone decarboxylase family protein n=1 Tax=Georgenia thermotolerans TaxID=527326 RepID=A0A7J5UL67_9MICO|nr:carboxymuconolactone decarboxylase family protein [Georgenia thermotolerans]KAE8763105.1 carboxymuconolactone decarboxylase family protein [Georgenia thermotolerans]